MNKTHTKPHRLAWLDAARGLALVAMTIYHFTWDLGLFGYIDPATATTGFWRIFARLIAGSFLIIVGLSMTLATANSFLPKGYLRRTVWVAGAAFLITIVTRFATPDSFIYFGILHHIALASLAGLFLVRAPIFVIVLTIFAVIAIDQTVHLAQLESRWLAWTGLSAIVPRSNDFVPFIPWFACVLSGIVAGRLLERWRWPEFKPAASKIARPLRFMGQHSLAYYLIHQPVLIAFVYIATLIAPPPPPHTRLNADEMIPECQTSCATTRNQAFCAAYCKCAFDTLIESKEPNFDEIARQCETQIGTHDLK